jgi:hypothetical protein
MATRPSQSWPNWVCHKTVFKSAESKISQGDWLLICAVTNQNQTNPATASKINVAQSHLIIFRQNDW